MKAYGNCPKNNKKNFQNSKKRTKKNNKKKKTHNIQVKSNPLKKQTTKS